METISGLDRSRNARLLRCIWAADRRPCSSPRIWSGSKRHLRSRFQFADDAEISVEMDPNDLDADKYDALAEIGMTRASIGVQDFDERVQKAINREQTFEQTREVVEQVRARGVLSVNCDVLYGLPHQTRQSVDRTIEQVISLRPDRIALVRLCPRALDEDPSEDDR
jgi:coproporphyrinogen III oxidase-like Fe-S oxidoreductase